MTKVTILALLVGLVLLFTLPASASAQRLPPHVFVGTATVDGAAASDGTAVTAWVGGVQVASGAVSGGSYTIVVDQGDQSFAGQTVNFQIGGNDAAESATWTQGGGDELNLTASSAMMAATATPAPTAAPTAAPIVSATGVPGERGPAGRAGPTGPAGSAGSRGAAGPSGATGATGATGPAGGTGAKGDTGAAGSSGAAGPAGASGSTGEKGDSGSNVLGIIALILAILAVVGAGGAYLLGRAGAN